MAAAAAPADPLLAGGGAALARLRERANTEPKAALREAARQFEALFMQEVMKSLRAATLAAGALDNEGSRLGTDLLDQQFALQLAGRPGGLSDAIVRQLEQQIGGAGAAPALTARAAPRSTAATEPLAAAAGPAGAPSRNAAEFVERHRAAARAAEAATGISAAFMIGQAAHETGWGRHQIRAADGTPSHNLFGIKAGPGWRGPVVEAVTTEVVDGREQRTVARFRAYASSAEAFADYAQLMRNSPRYREVLAQGRDAAGFAAELQRAGYATDPDYAAKLTRVINTALRLQRAAG